MEDINPGSLNKKDQIIFLNYKTFDKQNII